MGLFWFRLNTAASIEKKKIEEKRKKNKKRGRIKSLMSPYAAYEVEGAFSAD